MSHAVEDANYEAQLYPTCLEDATTRNIAEMWDFEVYCRNHLYGDSYVTSDRWGKQQKRDNRWVAFQHYTGPCVLYNFSMLISSRWVVNMSWTCGSCSWQCTYVAHFTASDVSPVCQRRRGW